jgi:SAM-dependent methyltransferase/uncharacterized protein YbaR (Trm112 family)
MFKSYERYRCPRCKGNLKQVSTEFNISCQACDLFFPIYENVPILIDEQHSVFRIQEIKDAACLESKSQTAFSFGVKSTARGLIKFLMEITPTLYSKRRAKEIANIFLNRINLIDKESVTILSIGNGTGGLIFNQLKQKSKFVLWETDVYMSEERMFISDIQQLPIPSESVDVILTEGVLEHVMSPDKAVSEIHRVLKPGGLVMSTTPFILGVHMPTADYMRFSTLGLIKLFDKFNPIECGVIDGVFVALAYQLSYSFMAIASVATSGNLGAIKLAKYCGNYLIFWLKFFDCILRKNAISEDAAASFYYIGKKQDSGVDDFAINSMFTGLGLCPK